VIRARTANLGVGTPRALVKAREHAMKRTIAIGMLGLLLASNRAAAQTAVERQQIVRDFQQSVVDHTQRNCLAFPEALHAATPASKVFTLPVAMVFRQIIGDQVIAHEHGEPPENVIAALPPLPEWLRYRLSGNDLEIRCVARDSIVAVVHDVFGIITVRN
jgi:hypothetical protein